MKEIFFYSGLPRSGSTMLGALLHQHSDLYCSPLSPVLELIYYSEDYFLNRSEQYAAFKYEAGMNSVIKNIPQSYYENISKKYILDKNRAWPNNINLIQQYITPNPKIICVVRDIPAILASFINILEKANNTTNFIDKYLVDNNIPVNTLKRCELLMSPKGIVYQSLQALHNGYKNNNKYLYLVEYDNIIQNPKKTVDNIIDYLGLESFEFNFNNIVNTVQEDDSIYNLPGMHEVRKEIKDNKLNSLEILGEDIYHKYSGLEFWRTKPIKIFGL